MSAVSEESSSRKNFAALKGNEIYDLKESKTIGEWVGKKTPTMIKVFQGEPNFLLIILDDDELILIKLESSNILAKSLDDSLVLARMDLLGPASILEGSKNLNG